MLAGTVCEDLLPLGKMFLVSRRYRNGSGEFIVPAALRRLSPSPYGTTLIDAIGSPKIVSRKVYLN